MFGDDDDLPAKKKPVPKNLTTMSVDALNDYIHELEAEIVRTRDEIKTRAQVHAAAQALFTKK